MRRANPRLRLPSFSRTAAFTTKTIRNVEKFRILWLKTSHSSREVITRAGGCQTSYSAEIGLKFVVLRAKKVAQVNKSACIFFFYRLAKSPIAISGGKRIRSSKPIHKSTFFNVSGFIIAQYLAQELFPGRAIKNSCGCSLPGAGEPGARWSSMLMGPFPSKPREKPVSCYRQI